ncbi:MAG TPA: SDR family NAD(P)-dependent oxidoreductase [Ilumatobacteraceae bacterium]|nr:SDR family NAD(P)-dependent oxidoreductase [Ilumatobacteraceae bacterium]
MELNGKAAIVTGAGTGVGRATALALAAAGCDVAVNYSRSKDAAEAVAAEATGHGVRAIAVQADVADDDDCRRLVATAHDAFGRLDVLVNNAGTTSFIPHDDLEAITADTWTSILGVNMIGPFQMARAASAALRADGGGHVVNVSSVAGVYGTGSSIPYCASKAGLNNLTVTLARVLGPEVQVNAVCPGFIDGSWLQEGFGDAFEAIKQSVVARTLLHRVCTPDDVKDAIFGFLLGSRLTTGEILVVDGGYGKAM